MAESFQDIYVDCIAKTQVDRAAVQRWLDHIGATEFVIPEEEAVSDPALLVALAAKRCYLSFQPGLNPNVTKVRQDMFEYLDNVLKQQHGSVLEHAVFTFAIEGCSRVFTGELNRHRAGVGISEGSMRYIRYDNIRYWEPECFRPSEADSPSLAEKKARSLKVLNAQFQMQEGGMRLFQEIWKEELAPESTFNAKKVLTSAFRRIVGMGIATGGTWTLNVRALRHVIALRTDPGAEEEIVHVFRKIGAYMIENLPELFSDFEDRNGSFIPRYRKV